ncbi:MAG: UTP--glucose-1-phosphate uridylyltransferase GalU [Candidatus Thermoplasmatota archaeon]|nr:UTP--glucose-1-phosphate uridylyltransferase GalU [Candidatus Thermoplasmatota archaeon]MBU4256642.1 UTP--glucose-1-phosphate uridylyltransferase GalU [Candidatus Thermoplasmatota archaeon]
MKAVIPAAGLGTRFLPATKAQPKEMLPLVDKPAIQYVVEEAVSSGIKDIIIITGRGKRAIEDHFDKSFELEYILKRAGKTEELKKIQEISNMARIHFIRQKEQRGLGDAILCAKKFVDDEPFAVLLGDDITTDKTPCTKQLIDVFNKYKKSVICVERMSKEKLHRYGVIKGKNMDDRIYFIENLVEKPLPDKAPSNLAMIGRYILAPDVFDCIEKTKPGINNEIQLTDALNLLRKNQDIYAYEFKGKRYDIGTKIDWVKANIALSLQNDDLKEELISYLRGYQLSNSFIQ